MSNIFTVNHPYFNNTDDGPYNRSMSLEFLLTFGNSVEESFPEHIEILTGHNSQWNFCDGDFSNKRNDVFLDNKQSVIDLGNFLRANMLDDVFIYTKTINYQFDASEEGSIFPAFEKRYFETDKKGNLVRLPSECSISYIELRFRDVVDKTQFLLLNDGKYTINSGIYEHSKKKHHTNRYSINDGRGIKCPYCEVKFDEEKYKKTQIKKKNERLKTRQIQ